MKGIYTDKREEEKFLLARDKVGERIRRVLSAREGRMSFERKLNFFMSYPN